MAEKHTGPMAGRTVLVTGGTGGIGKATAEGLARLGARVGIAGRDLQRARSAAAAITVATGNPAIDAYAAGDVPSGGVSSGEALIVEGAIV
jgi:retinol dehydrogenase-14